MDINDKPVHAIEETDLQELVLSGRAEGQMLEYKEALPTEKERDKKELLADVCAFANTAGGLLIFGIKEGADGVAADVCGVTTSDIDAEIRRLESSLDSGVQPRIHGLATHHVPLANGRVAILIRVPRSWNSPHMITYQDWSRFYARRSRQRLLMDVGDIRAAFLRSEATADRVRNFRADRLAKIVANETPVPLVDLPKTVLHIIPLTAFDPGMRFDVNLLEHDASNLTRIAPISALSFNHRHNFDGLLTYVMTGSGKESGTYVQLFRNGIIEAVDATLLNLGYDDRRIPSKLWEREVVRALPRFLLALQQLGVEPPLLIMLSLISVKGATMAVDPVHHFVLRQDPIDRDILVIPEILIDTYEISASKELKSAFDAVWNAAGWAGSPNYDEAGQWTIE